MQFNVELSELAEQQYDKILSYIAYKLKNPQALQNVMDDFDDTVEKLEKMADSFGYCNSDRLKELGLHKIHFSKHRYMFVYRVDKSKVIIEGMYHEMQDYENSIW
ncbi:MAG: type II toxin-antitoxin system RelE/ParE family toxin [Lachnospiraceae bacterium]|nr:type II toxin-antitoxin system RelE/ParE family toxin [Lachnospiraceae bacterium]